MKAALVLAALTLAVPVLAETPVADRAAFVALIEAHDCRMTEDEADKLLPSAGFTKDITRSIVDDLLAEGLAEIGEAGIILKTGNCH